MAARSAGRNLAQGPADLVPRREMAGPRDGLRPGLARRHLPVLVRRGGPRVGERPPDLALEDAPLDPRLGRLERSRSRAGLDGRAGLVDRDASAAERARRRRALRCRASLPCAALSYAGQARRGALAVYFIRPDSLAVGGESGRIGPDGVNG